MSFEIQCIIGKHFCVPRRSLEEFKLAYYNSNDPCLYCPCNASTLPWRDLSFNALWIAATWTSDNWLALIPNSHVVFTIMCVTILSVVTDILHVKHLGVDTNIAGSVLWLLCYQVLPGIHPICLVHSMYMRGGQANGMPWHGGGELACLVHSMYMNL